MLLLLLPSRSSFFFFKRSLSFKMAKDTMPRPWFLDLVPLMVVLLAVAHVLALPLRNSPREIRGNEKILRKKLLLEVDIRNQQLFFLSKRCQIEMMFANNEYTTTRCLGWFSIGMSAMRHMDVSNLPPNVFVFEMQITISSNIIYKLVMGCIWLPHRLCFCISKCYIFLDNCLRDVESCLPIAYLCLSRWSSLLIQALTNTASSAVVKRDFGMHVDCLSTIIYYSSMN
ncbi:hypothetical protein SADUNF_Sadunf18G0009600 [Salix dunnii]|uniref:Uncharacterized protein n=1 Tax=Salix dunnii TaxID=1413687 RepID=A0A835J4S4_9ROSI|nr:hypothetical protein SADUNF_Sadunf18G0009600 [Salix dunnii]